MSVIAAKKAQRRTGNEDIFYYIALTISAIIIIELLCYKFLNWVVATPFLGSLFYFIILASMFFAMPSSFQENPDNKKVILKNWLLTMIVVSLLFAVIFATYNW